MLRNASPMAGNSTSACTAGTKPVAVMAFHGDNDAMVSISSGRMSRDTFVMRNGCMQQNCIAQ